MNSTLSIIVGGIITVALYPRFLLTVWTLTVSTASIYLHLYQVPLASATIGAALYACFMIGLLNQLNYAAQTKKSHGGGTRVDIFLRGWLFGGVGITVGTTLAALVASKSILAIGQCLVLGVVVVAACVVIMLVCNILSNWGPSPRDSTSATQPAQPLSLSSSTQLHPSH